MRGGALLLLVLSLVAVGCASSDSGASAGSCPTGSSKCGGPTLTCPAGFAPRDQEAGCDPILPDTDCPAGTRPDLGSTMCAAVGWASCPAGFQPDASGWGCAEVLPPKACTGATIERLGSASCQPIGDCSAAFPPPGATYFVDASYTASQLDATHFASIGAALAAAPGGATIAVNSGTYVEALAPARAVTLVGRCAANVVVQSPDGMGIGLDVYGVEGVAVRGVSFRGHGAGVSVEAGSLTLEDALIADTQGVGVAISGSATDATLTDVVVRGSVDTATVPGRGIDVRDGGHVDVERSAIVANAFMNVFIGENGSATLAQSVVRDAFPETTGDQAGSFGDGVYAFQGGSVTITECALIGNHTAGLGVATTSTSGTPSKATVARTVIRGTLANGHQKFGRGVEVSGGATADVTDSLIAGNAEDGVIASINATATLQGCDVLGGPPPPGGLPAQGILASDGSTVTATSTAFVGNVGAGLDAQKGSSLTVRQSLVRDPVPTTATVAAYADDYGIGVESVAGGALALDHSAVVAARALGLFVDGASSTLTATGTVVLHTQPEPGGYKAGRAAGAQYGARLELDGSALVDQHVAGLYAAKPGTVAVVQDTVIASTAPNSAGMHGHGIVCVEGANVSAIGSTLHDSAAIGFVVDASSGFVQSTIIANNQVGIHVQDGSTLSQGEMPPTDPLGVVVSSDTRFVGNGARIGSGTVPLPDPIGAPAP